MGVLINCFYQTVPPLNSAKGSGQTFDSVLAIITRLKFTPKATRTSISNLLVLKCMADSFLNPFISLKNRSRDYVSSYQVNPSVWNHSVDFQ